MSLRRSSRMQAADIGSLMATKNNNLAASAASERGVIVRRGHAFFKVTIGGITHVYNGNDGEDGIGFGEFSYSPSENADGSYVAGAIRPLMHRRRKILQSEKGDGNCYMVAVALSRRYYDDPSTFDEWAMNCSERDCYDYVN